MFGMDTTGNANSEPWEKPANWEDISPEQPKAQSPKKPAPSEN